jgi:hypothetical protein
LCPWSWGDADPATNAELRRLATATTVDNPRWPRLQRRAAVLYGSNLLLSVVWAMLFEPIL